MPSPGLTSTLAAKYRVPGPGPIDEEGRKWFTTVGLIKDIWRSYTFEPSQNKAEMLFKPIDFAPSAAAGRSVNTHVELRNCIQHHAGQLTPDALKRLGLPRPS